MFSWSLESIAKITSYWRTLLGTFKPNSRTSSGIALLTARLYASLDQQHISSIKPKSKEGASKT